ncbi:MAG TPA: FtsX-like permease family protein [Mycobacteriales bacterium]
MYPERTPALVTLLVVCAAAAAYIAVRRPFLRRLALRQVARRRGEAMLVIGGSVLGTAIIIGSLVVGDTLNFSVRQGAYTNLGPIDEIVTSATIAQGDEAAARLRELRGDPQVDGVLTVRAAEAAAVTGADASRRAEPRISVYEGDLVAAGEFGGSADGGSGLGGPTPVRGEAVVNADLADTMGVGPGDALTLYLYGKPTPFRVARVVPTRGVAGVSTGPVSRNAFLAPGTLVEAARAARSTVEPRTVTFVSNVGGVEDGDAASDAVEGKIRAALGPLTGQGTSVEKAKQALLDAAKAAGDGLGSFFLFIGSFSIIAGVLLLVNIFVMLAEERKSELGMLRAIGMKRSRLVRSFVIEGTVYALVASLVGILVGIGVGRAVVVVAAQIFNSFSAEEGGLTLAFNVTPVSIVNGFALGFLIAFLTVALTSLRISRVNIISAIRDLPTGGVHRTRRRWVIASTVLAALTAAAAVPAIADSQGLGTYLYPALTVVLLCPLLVRLAPKRWVYTAAAAAVLGWGLVANTVRPKVLENGSTVTFVVLGIMLTFSAVFLVSQNQDVLTRPFRRFMLRPTPGGLASRLAIAYPVARKFRTGAILIMYSLVVFTLVLITVLGSLVNATVDNEVANASGGFAVRADFNPANPIPDPARTLTSGRFSGAITDAVPLLVAPGKISNVGRLSRPTDTVVIGADPAIAETGLYPLTKRLDGLGDDRATWRAVMTDRRYVIIDQFLGSTGGGPPTMTFTPGQTLTLTDPATGRAEQKTIAGILKSGNGFYGVGGTSFVSPTILSASAATAQFGGQAKLASALVKTAAGVSDDTVAADLQGQFLPQSLVATRVRQAVEKGFGASRGFFQLMQGFLALGLLVGIAGLGVVMVRAVRERRRTIGVLRALGFPASTVQRAFLTESSFVASEGIVLGAALSVLTSYLLFENDPSFAGTGIGFPIPWLSIAILIAAATVASLLATFWPAHQAARIRPAVALRIAD